MEKFNEVIQPYQDWMQLGWIQQYVDDKFGQGIKAVRHIPKTKTGLVAADLRLSGLVICSGDADKLSRPSPYCFALNRKEYLNIDNHWIGKINHCPMPHCNLKLTAAGQLIQ